MNSWQRKIIRARIHIFTYLKAKDFKGPKDKEGVSIYYDFEIDDKKELDYKDYFLPDNYDTSKDGMYRIFL